MSTFFNKGQRMPNIFERARAYEDAQDYTIKNSPLKKNELFNFFKQYGGNGIKINIDFK